MKKQYLPLFRRIQQFNLGKFAGHYGSGISIYPKVNYRNPNSKVIVQVNWSCYGSMHPNQAKIFNNNLKEAIRIAKQLSGKLTEKEFRELREYAEEESFKERGPKPGVLNF